MSSDGSVTLEKQVPKTQTAVTDAELGETLHSDSHTPPDRASHHHYISTSSTIASVVHKQRQFWHRLQGKDRPRIPGWTESGKNILFSSLLNVLLICLPLAWIAHFVKRSDGEHVFPDRATFALCFLSIIPLEKLFDYGGEQMALYLGKDLGDLAIITLNNAVEATLAIILLAHCELRILQSTLIGVVILHLLLIPGTAFLAGGAQIWEQNLHPHQTQLNHSLLTIGVLTLLLPTAFFAALDRGALGVSEQNGALIAGPLITDEVRGQLLQMSRGLAVVLLAVYISSRVFLANPPGDNNALGIAPNAPLAYKEEEHHLTQIEPEVGPWACILMLIVTVSLMAVTAEWLVESIEFVRETGGIQDEWFGLILLPIVSFSADGTLAIIYFCRSIINHVTGWKPIEPSQLAKGRAIDLSIQFTLFWMPFLVLLAWWASKPLHLMFDYFELALLLGSCFLVNYVTADSKTNWVEGLILVSFYVMIAIVAWFYTGQPEQEVMLACHESVAGFLASGGDEGEAAAEASHAAFRLLQKFTSGSH